MPGIRKRSGAESACPSHVLLGFFLFFEALGAAVAAIGSSISTASVTVGLSFGVESFCRFCCGTALADTSLKGFRARFAGMIVIGN